MRSIHHVLHFASRLPHNEIVETSDALDALDGGLQVIDDQIGMGWASDFAGYHWEISPLHNPPAAPMSGEDGAAGGILDTFNVHYWNGQPRPQNGSVVEVFRDGSGRSSDGTKWERGFGPGAPYADGARGPGFRPGRYTVRGEIGELYRRMHPIGFRPEIVGSEVPAEFRRDPMFVTYWGRPEFRSFYRDPWFRHYWGMPEFRRAWGHPEFATHWGRPEFRRDFDRPEFRRTFAGHWERPEFRREYERPEFRTQYAAPEFRQRYEVAHPGLSAAERPGGRFGGGPGGLVRWSAEQQAKLNQGAERTGERGVENIRDQLHRDFSGGAHAAPVHAASPTWSGPRTVPAPRPASAPQAPRKVGMSGTDDDMGRSVSYGGGLRAGGFGPFRHRTFHRRPIALASVGTVLAQHGHRVTVRWQDESVTVVLRAILHPAEPFRLPRGAVVRTTADIGEMGAAEQYLSREAEQYRPDSWRRKRIEEEIEREREADRERPEHERRERERFRGHERMRRGYMGEAGDLAFCMGEAGDVGAAIDAHREQQIDVATHNATQAARAQISVAREGLWDQIVAAVKAGEVRALAALRSAARALFDLARRVAGSADAAVAVATASPAEIKALAQRATKGESITATPAQYQAMLQPAFIAATPGAAPPAPGAPAPIAPTHAEVKNLPVATIVDGQITIDPYRAAEHASLTAIPSAAPPQAAESASPAALPAGLPAALSPVATEPAAVASPVAPALALPMLDLPPIDEDEDADDGYSPSLSAEIDAGPPRGRCASGSCKIARTDDEELDARADLDDADRDRSDSDLGSLGAADELADLDDGAAGALDEGDLGSLGDLADDGEGAADELEAI